MLEWTGERFLPWIQESTIAYEHLHRYAYAATLVKNKRVLDLACGEGYGAKMLAAAAASVVGVDIDNSAVQHASQKYGSANLQFLSGSITAVPIPDEHVFDVIVCFEAIEHIDDQDGLLKEVRRLLKSDGVFIVSTPNKAIYHDESPEDNPFHVKELYFDEFRALLARYFQNIQFLGQRIHPSSSLWPLAESNPNGFHEFAINRKEAGFEFIGSDKRVALYFIAIASDSLSALHPSASVLIDESDGLLEEKDRERERQVRDREETIKSRDEALKWRERQIDELTQALEWANNRAAAMEKTIASQQEGLQWRAQQVEDLDKAKAFWEQESAALHLRLQNTQRQLASATDTLAGIYASRGWKLILKLRRVRDRIRGVFR